MKQKGIKQYKCGCVATKFGKRFRITTRCKKHVPSVDGMLLAGIAIGIFIGRKTT